MDALGAALAPVVAERMTAAAQGKEWVALYEAKESLRRGHRYTVNPGDPRLLLRILRFERSVFTEIDTSQRAWIDELIQASNRAAHSPVVSRRDADRALDTMSLLAESLDLAEALDVITTVRAASSPTARDAGEGQEAGLKGQGMAVPREGEPDRGVRVLAARLGDLDVAVVVVEAMNYALVHNGISPVLDVRVQNRGTETVRDVRLELAIDSPLEDSPVAAPLVIGIGDVPAQAAFEVPLSELAWRLSSAPFVAFDEAVSTEMRLTVETVSMTYTDTTTVRLLTADEWWAASLRETLAAFVRPNEPVVHDLLGQASEFLQARTGSPALEGYQTGPERVHLIAEAIFDALSAAQIRYMEPPASFEGTGQRIRSHADVIADKNGTCLDLAALYAACLEQAGLHPVIVLATGHALTGYLTEDAQLPDASVTQHGAIATIFDADLFEPVETTAVCARDEPYSFDTARAQARRWRTTHLDDVVSLLDVKAAHRLVKPLPNIRIEGGVKVVETVKEVQTTAPQRRRTGAREEVAEVGAASVPPRVERWRRSLLDMTYLNPLLKLKKASSLPVHVPTDTLAALEDHVADGARFTLLPQTGIAQVHQARGARTAADIEPDVLQRLLLEERRMYVATTDLDYHSKLRGLARKAKTALEETGTDSLYLTIGTLEWDESGKQGKAPMFLVPVKIMGGRGTTPFTLVLDETRQVEPNYCLVEKLRASWGLHVPELINPGEDDSGMDIEGALAAVRSALWSEGLVNHHVEETAHLANLQFSTIDLWRDLGENWASFMARPAVEHLVDTPGQPYIDPATAPAPDPAAEAVTYLPIPADGSQIEAVRWAAAGRSFILEGPPGTGKSQTITNLVAHLLAEGKKVLFVAEKQAALDVVKTRLDAVGLGAFSLDIHGKTQTVKAVREQIATAMDTRTESSSSWETARAQFRGLVDSLSSYPQLLHEPGPADMSAWEARQVVLELRESTNEVDPVPAPRSLAMGAVPLEQVYQFARDLGSAMGQLGAAPARSPWRLAGPTAPDRAAVAAATQRLLGAEDALAGNLRALTDQAQSRDEFEAIFRWVESVRVGAGRSTAEARETVTQAWRTHAQQVRTAVANFVGMHATQLSPLAPSALSIDLDGLLARAIEADGKLFGKKKRRLAILNDLAPVLTGGPTALPPAQLTTTLRRAIVARDDLNKLTNYVGTLPGVTAPYGWNPLDPDGASAVEFAILGLEDAHRLSATIGEAVDAATRTVLAQPEPLTEMAAASVQELAGAWAEFSGALGATPSDLVFWLSGRTRGQAVAQSRAEWEADATGGALIRLQRWNAVRAATENVVGHGITDIHERVRSGSIRGSEVENAVRLGIAEAILAERLEATGLDGFDDADRGRLIERFITSGEDVRSRMLTELPARIVAGRTIDTNQPRGKVANLRAQLGRRRGGLAIRQLLEEYGPIITQVTPCFLMSPASVARFLPANAVDFDVVVFDEASQIRVPDAIGAMGRGKAVVIVGDSQQMPPSAAFAAASRDDDESSLPADAQLVPRDLESILTEGVESRLPRLLLSWHYRSRDEALIAFSNKSFYEGRLSSFPTPPHHLDTGAVELRRVNGAWEGGGRGAARVNRAEADAVVREIKAILQTSPDRSIGVVTFNTQQRDLILDTLETERETSDALEAALSRTEEPLFVKNLENVQGDERDIILFTLAFAKDARGRVPLNWGPLSRAGGEKRLNVAVTRAKEKVTIFASFDPHEMDLSGSGSVGLARMKDYLLLAKHGVERAGFQRAAARDWHLSEIEAALKEADLEVRTGIGLSDFTVDLAVRAADDRPWIAVMLDGPTWAQRNSVGDRDGLPGTVLTKQMGWSKVERVWLPTWLRVPDEVVKQIVDAAQTAVATPDRPSSAARAETVAASQDVRIEEAHLTQDDVNPASRSRWGSMPAHGGEDAGSIRAAPTTQSPSRSALPDGVSRFVSADNTPRHPSVILDETSTRVRSLVQQEIHDIVGAEGPIVEDRLLKIVAARFGFGTLRATRRDQLKNLIPRGLVTAAPNRDRIAWPDGSDPGTYVGYRVPETGELRDLADVPYHELRNALVRNVRAAHSLTEDEALRDVAREFGYARFAAKARGRLDGVVDAAVKEGVVTRSGVYLEVSVP